MHIEEQFQKFVPAQFVPDEYDVGEERVPQPHRTKLVQSTLTCSFQSGATDANASAGPLARSSTATTARLPTGNVSSLHQNNSLKKPRWKSRTCETALISIIREHVSGKVPTSSFNVRKMATLMPKEDDLGDWCPTTLKRHAICPERIAKL